MSYPDPARAIKDVIQTRWATAHSNEPVTLSVDDDQKAPWLLVADDGGVTLHGRQAWILRKDPRRITIRITAASAGRTDARSRVVEAADWVCDHKPAAIGRIDNVSAPLITRDRATGAYLASVAMPVIVKPA